MTKSNLISVLTTIQPPTAAVRTLCRTLRRTSGHLIVVGDRKGPDHYPVGGAELWSLARQQGLPLQLPRLLPVDHYTRKNIGYLIAISRQPGCIYETDDDNCPLASWRPRSSRLQARTVTSPHWCNVYRWFTRAHIWPRGLPLSEIMGRAIKPEKPRTVFSPIQQGLADGSPDVDAIWRLTLDMPVSFDRRPSVALNKRVWCPFNSQSTWWWPEAFPLMYLPSHCTFRMTDIWRSLVAQRCVWELGGSVTFHAAEVMQKRNPHNLMKDFQDEIPGYLSNELIRRTLEDVSLIRGQESVGDNLMHCYESLVKSNIFPRKELPLVRSWLRDLDRVTRGLEF